MVARVLQAAVFFVLALQFGCVSDEGVELFVDLRTDLVPVHEFQILEVLLEAPGARNPIQDERLVTSDELFVEGQRVTEFSGLDKGTYRLIIRLRTEGGSLVAERPAAIDLRSNRVVTVVITRDCRVVTCEDPGRTACLQGQCVPETCTPETPETCPGPNCATASDCPLPVAECAEAFCAEDTCFARIRTADACVMGMYCNAGEGCLPENSGPAPTCTDGAQNGDETGVDCGGPCPMGCPNGESCTEALDCLSGYCTAARACDAPTCRDRVANGDETGVDCGGSCTACTGLCTGVVEVPVPECQALEALYASTRGTGWNTNTDWLVTNTPCSWYGVTCEAGHVSELSLAGGNLAGPIPPELGNLSGLTTLSLFANPMTGPIPPELGNLSSLTVLALHGNRLTSPIPPELGNLSSLTRLSLSSNSLTGPIPPELGNLSSLTTLSLYSNQLTGPIPPELGNLSNLTSLSLYSNQLSGPLPPEFGNLSSLMVLSMSSNLLAGDLPSELGNLANLGALRLESNQFTGVSPNAFNTLSSIGLVLLNENQLDQANVDELLSQVYAGRMTYTHGAPHIRLHGTNAAPSGNATDPAVTPGNGASNSDWSWNGSCHDPLSGKAMAYTLENDNCAEGFNTWTFIYTP